MSFKVSMLDIEQLNKAAVNHEYDMIKISYSHYPKISEAYQLLRAGSAMGFGNGPLLVARRKIHPDEFSHLKIAIPGIETTANMLLTLAYPEVSNKPVYLFSNIEDAVLSGEVDAGLLIHETRFTYEKKQLHKLIDLGEFWETKTGGLPLPLGAIAVKRKLSEDTKKNMNNAVSESVLYALKNPQKPEKFVLNHANEIDIDVCRKHINLYVNEFSVDIGDTGKKAVDALLTLKTNNIA